MAYQAQGLNEHICRRGQRPAYDPRTDESDLHTAAMAIGGERRFGAVNRRNWERLARRSGVEADRLLTRVGELAADLPEALAAALDSVPPSEQRDDLRRRLLGRVSTHLETARRS